MPGRAGNKTSSSSTPSRATDTSVHEKLDLILKRLDSFDSRLTKLELEQAEMAKGLNFMSSEIQDLKNGLKTVNSDKIAQLKEEIDELTHQKNRKIVIIDGIPHNTNEDLFKAVEAFSKKIDCEINPQTDIDNLYRIRQSNKIVVQFLQIYKRDKFLSSCKGVNVIASDIGFRANQTKIYVNEMLTPKQAALFHNVRNFKKANGFKFAWTHNQRIFLRKAPDSDVILIRSIDDLDSLK